jgi:DNA repair exonuclease SbcCD ATPase subunit
MQELFINLDAKIKGYDDLITMRGTELVGLSIEANPFSKSVQTIKDEESEKITLVKSLEEEVEILNYVKYLCSPEGVKSHILLKIVDLFNAKLNSYLHTLNAPFTITFNELFEETILNSNGATVSYNSLSGGERKRVDLAILFTFRDIRRIQSNISINVTLFDELFDSALCSHGMEQALSILEDQANEYNESILIITHRMDQIEDRGNIIYLEKENGITTLVDSGV